MTIKERFLILALVLQGCTSAPKKMIVSGATPLLIETKVQTKDLQKSETNTANLEIILLTNQAIRMEVTALLGYRVASVVITPQKIQYALHTSKTYVQGPFAAKTMYPIFKQNIDPKLLWRIIHGQNPESAEMKCQKDSTGRPLACISQVGQLTTNVIWNYDVDNKKRIEIKNRQFEMTWVFKSQSAMESYQNETFVLKKPEDYKETILK